MKKIKLNLLDSGKKNFSNKKLNYVFLFLSIFIVGAFFRLYHLGTDILWVDEPFSTFFSQKPLLDILKYISVDSNPPLYYILLHFWIKLFGDSLFIIRLFSVAVGLIDLLLFYFIIKKLFGKQIAFISYTILALSPYFIFYSRLARTFPLLLLFTLLSYWCFNRFFINKSENIFHALGFVFFSTLAVYTHYYAIFFLLAISTGYILWSFIKSYRKLWAKFLFSLLAIFLLFSAWLPFFLIKWLEQKNGHWSSMSSRSVFDIFDILFIKSIFLEFNMASFFDRIILIILIIVIIFLFVNFWNKNKKRIISDDNLLFLFIILLLLVIFFLIYSNNITPRYIIYFLIVYLPLLSMVIIYQKKAFRNLPLLFIIGLCLLNINKAISYNNSEFFYKWKPLVENINHLQKENDCIFVHEPHFTYYYKYYNRRSIEPLEILPVDVYKDKYFSCDPNIDRDYYRSKWLGYNYWLNQSIYNELSDSLDSKFSSCQRIWLIYYAPHDNYGLIPFYFNTNFGKPITREYFDKRFQVSLYNNKNYQSNK